MIQLAAGTLRMIAHQGGTATVNGAGGPFVVENSNAPQTWVQRRSEWLSTAILRRDTARTVV